MQYHLCWSCPSHNIIDIAAKTCLAIGQPTLIHYVLDRLDTVKTRCKIIEFTKFQKICHTKYECIGSGGGTVVQVAAGVSYSMYNSRNVLVLYS